MGIHMQKRHRLLAVQLQLPVMLYVKLRVMYVKNWGIIDKLSDRVIAMVGERYIQLTPVSRCQPYTFFESVKRFVEIGIDFLYQTSFL